MRALTAALCALATVAWATPPARPAAEPAEAGKQDREQMEKHMRTLRTVGVAEALDLDTADALKVDSQMRSFDERRRPLQKLIHESMRTLKRAADGDAQALAQVDSVTQKILDTRTQLAQLDREMYVSLAQGRSAQQKARLALFLAHFREEARSMKGMGWHGPGGKPGQDEP